MNQKQGELMKGPVGHNSYCAYSVHNYFSISVLENANAKHEIVCVSLNDPGIKQWNDCFKFVFIPSALVFMPCSKIIRSDE